MKLLALFFVAAFIAIAVYLLISKWFKSSKKYRKLSRTAIFISIFVFISLLGVIAYGIYISDHQPDLQCTSTHMVSYNPPAHLAIAMDYFAQGNYDYDSGKCKQAVADYTEAIARNPKFSQAYNNRAYTYMRMRDFQDALLDLDKAISLNPQYVQALMNRGDIHNYYYQIDRTAAIADYRKVIAITGTGGGNTSVCGHLFLAEHNGWNLGTYLDFFAGGFNRCN